MSFLIPKITDVIDILMVSFLLYRLIFLLKKTGGFQVILGFGLVLLLYFTASVLNLSMMTSFLKLLKDYWVIAFIIIFHPEIRNLFSRLVRNRDLMSVFKDTKKKIYSRLLNTVSIMSFRKIGALIVIENNGKLDDYVESGETIDAWISTKLLLTIFNSKTILHDGAVIIRKERILAVKVVLPLSENIGYTQKFGTRHLAAIGITEKSDAFAIVVSEETGRISVAKNGIISTDLTIDELSQKIKDETI
ncbi:MAG: TIGR00159 family protein [Armatimonadetes bacterium]|nr:TIGR00159 family protein [Armatimonadota bacterium]